MNKIIEKQIEELKFKDKQQCIEALVNEGLIVTNANTMEFTENYITYKKSIADNSFKTLMKGSVSFDSEKNRIRWVLRMNGLIFKFFLTFILFTLAWQLFMQSMWKNSLLMGGLFAILILWINWLRLNIRLERITGKMTINENNLKQGGHIYSA